jgi:hypothetical protein
MNYQNNKKNNIMKNKNYDFNNISDNIYSYSNARNTTNTTIKNIDYDIQNMNLNNSNISNNSTFHKRKNSKNSNPYKTIIRNNSEYNNNYVYKQFQEKDFLNDKIKFNNNTPQKINNNNNLSLLEINSRIQKKDEEEYNRLNNKLDDLVNFINNMQNI